MKYKRNARGALLLLVIVIVFVIITVFMLGCRIVQFAIDKQQYQQALEAASMQAALDLSKIVINDPYFGFISLSDQLAVGRATTARDGEPLPVHSINTIIGTTRLDYIVACELGDQQLQDLAKQDIRRAREAAIRLDRVLELSLKPKSNDADSMARDLDGNEVHPYADALKQYEEGTQSFTRSGSDRFILALGWLRGGGQTITPAPMLDQSQDKNSNDQYLPFNAQANGFYRAYIDEPVGDEHFAFASVSPEVSQVSCNQFIPKPPEAENKDYKSFVEATTFIPEKYNQYLSSIVRAQAEWSSSDLFSWGSGKASTKGISAACAQPYAVSVQPAPSIFVIAFPDGPPSGINTISDLLCNQGLMHSNMNTFTPRDGDFPVDPEAHLQPLGSQTSASKAFAQAYYDWLRSNYTLPKAEAILGALKQSFDDGNQSGIASVYVADITEDGRMVVSRLLQNPFTDIRVNDNQFYAISYTSIPIDSFNWTVVCRDQVHNLGTIVGGKHGGQPMPGDPVNWSELSSYVNSAFSAAVVNRKPPGITLVGQEMPGGAIALLGSQLTCIDGKELPRDIRKSVYSGGLGIEIRISSPMATSN